MANTPSGWELKYAELRKQLEEKDLQILRQQLTLDTLMDKGSQHVLQSQNEQILGQQHTLDTLMNKGTQHVLKSQKERILAQEETIDAMKKERAEVAASHDLQVTTQQEQITIQQDMIEDLYKKLEVAADQATAKIQAERQNLLGTIEFLKKKQTEVGDDQANQEWLQKAITALKKKVEEEYA